MELHAHAKLNLTLRITGRRADGYHLLVSLVVFTGLHDVLRLEPADVLTLDTTGPFAGDAGSEADNLVLRAARRLREASGTPYGARLFLEKNIPVGAGLGGGSADAAATLRGLNRLWELGWSDTQLAALGLTLGADVPMCLRGVPLIARGIGEQLEPLSSSIPPLSAVLVHPRTPLLTADVYAMYHHQMGGRAGDHAVSAVYSDDIMAAIMQTGNDLQAAAIAVSPVVAEVLLAMETTLPQPELVRMTGSGACCFALFRDQVQATAYAAQLRKYHSEWFVHAVPLLT